MTKIELMEIIESVSKIITGDIFLYAIIGAVSFGSMFPPNYSIIAGLLYIVIFFLVCVFLSWRIKKNWFKKKEEE